MFCLELLYRVFWVLPLPELLVRLALTLWRFAFRAGVSSVPSSIKYGNRLRNRRAFRRELLGLAAGCGLDLM